MAPTINLPRALVVEDNVQYSIELMRALDACPNRFDVIIASNVREAIPHIENDDIDIYVVDLRLPKEGGALENVEVGKELIRRIIERTNAGIVIHSNIPLNDEAEELLMLGADDYLEKGSSPAIVKAKAWAVWRRVKSSRPSPDLFFSRSNRRFLIGDWQFTIGSRELISAQGSVRVTPTEHAFLQYLCTVDAEIDRKEFNVAVLGRSEADEDKRIDQLVYKLRGKLGESFQLVSKRDGVYRLLNAKELRA